MIVVDCTVLWRHIAMLEDAAPADRLWRADPEWCAPAFWAVEFVSVIRKYERAGRLSTVAGDEYLERAVDLLRDAGHAVSAFRVLEASRRTGCSTSDCHYIALAEDLGLKLYTYDEEILRKCPRLARRP